MVELWSIERRTTAEAARVEQALEARAPESYPTDDAAAEPAVHSDRVVEARQSRFSAQGPSRHAAMPASFGSVGSLVEVLGRLEQHGGAEQAAIVLGPSGPVRLSASEVQLGRAAATRAMDSVAVLLEAEVETVVDAWSAQQESDDAHPVASSVSRMLGDVGPFEAELRESLGFAKAALGRYRHLVEKGALTAGAKELEAAELAVQAAKRAWTAVRLGVVEGAGHAVEGLEHTRNAAALTVGILATVASGGAAAAVVYGGESSAALATAASANLVATATPVLATAGEVGARLRADMPVDWTTMAKDAALGVVLARFGGHLSNRLFKRLAGRPELRGVTRAAFARVVSTVMTHEASTAVSVAACTAIEAARGRDVTWAQLSSDIADRLSDPKGIFIAALFGAVAARGDVLASRSAKAVSSRQTGAGGTVDDTDFEAAEQAYVEIRESSTDVESIATQTGLKAKSVAKVKRHLFEEEHLLDRYRDIDPESVEMRRFDADPRIANAWRRLEAGTGTAEDRALLRHEAAEAWYMRRHGPSYTDAHERAQRSFPSPYESKSSGEAE